MAASTRGNQTGLVTKAVRPMRDAVIRPIVPGSAAVVSGSSVVSGWQTRGSLGRRAKGASGVRARRFRKEYKTTS